MTAKGTLMELEEAEKRMEGFVRAVDAEFTAQVYAEARAKRPDIDEWTQHRAQAVLEGRFDEIRNELMGKARPGLLKLKGRIVLLKQKLAKIEGR